MKIKILTLMRNLTTQEIRSYSRDRLYERQQLEIKKTSKIQMGIGMIIVVYMYLQVIETG